MLNTQSDGGDAVKSSKLNRRDFTKLTSAALGGMVAGVAASQIAVRDATAGELVDATFLTEGKNVCRGLNNSCGNHKGGDNKCAGQGACHTAKKHGCHGKNECKGEGGCGTNPGENDCSGKGKCAVPLGDKAWKAARANFEAAMKKAGKDFGDAPPKS